MLIWLAPDEENEERRAQRIIHYLLGGYRRLALINTGQHDLELYRAYARGTAGRFNLRYEEISGNTGMIERWFSGDWDNDFLVIPPGNEVEHAAFLPMLLVEPFSAQSVVSSEKRLPAE